MADVQLNTLISSPIGLLGHSSSVPGRVSRADAGNLLAPHGANATISQVERTVGDYFGIGPYNLYQFGAEPQTRLQASPTSYQTQLQNAIDRAAAAKRPLLVPPGVWHHTGLVLRSESALIGCGRYLSGFRILNNTQAHNFRGTDNTVANVELAHFFIDGTRFISGTTTADINSQGWGDGIYSTASSNAALFAAQDLNVPRANAMWRLHDLEVFQCMRHGIYLEGVAEHKCYDILIGDCKVDGLHNRATDSFFTNIDCAGIGRNGIVANGGNSKYNSCKTYFCGASSTRADGQAAGIANQWVTTSGGTGEVGGGGCVGIQVRDSGISQIFTNCETQDTWSHGWVFSSAKDVLLRGCQSNNVKSMRGQHTQGSATTVTTAVLLIEGTTKGCDIDLSHKDSWGTINYTTDNALRWLNTTSEDNKVVLRYDERQGWSTPTSFVNETQATAEGRGNSFSLAAVNKG